jgi:hypothetical protein
LPQSSLSSHIAKKIAQKGVEGDSTMKSISSDQY